MIGGLWLDCKLLIFHYLDNKKAALKSGLSFFKNLSLVPRVGLEPTRLFNGGFWIRCVYQFRHPGNTDKFSCWERMPIIRIYLVVASKKFLNAFNCLNFNFIDTPRATFFLTFHRTLSHDFNLLLRWGLLPVPWKVGNKTAVITFKI